MLVLEKRPSLMRLGFSTQDIMAFPQVGEATNARVCSAGDEVDAGTTVAVRLGWFVGVKVALAEQVADLVANLFSGIWIKSV